MIFLWSFGRRVEDACGPWRFLIFYLVAGMIAHIASYLLNPSRPDIPSIGASGAISGVMGAYLVLFPGAMVTCFWGIGIILRVPIVAIMKANNIKSVQEAPIWRWTISLPAWFVLIAFLLQEVLPSLQTIQQGRDFAGVNNLAHVAGFMAALVIFFYVRKDVMTRYIAGRRL
jgi:membrane associated rhomboid family serine protease